MLTLDLFGYKNCMHTVASEASESCSGIVLRLKMEA
jgi:hypothetical protein